ncbi:CvpA family protein [Butyrivibrio sp. X503]|uniref:CvpA family protein n=1 Tax=Butyrivibrio sp. X503 TaxID=2364878 RepID=UPI000EA9C880|nr:CvpA family protein [Butyrivibrio sp. X503]RKM54609.1 CvpA family protein [Butyrivibrio sp. X503]
MNFDIAQVVLTTVVVCLFLWRMSYGAKNGLFAEAAGLVSVLAAFVSIYYITKIAGDVLNANFGTVIPKIGYLVVAFLIYRLMTAIGDAFSKVKEVPVLSGFNRLLGAVFGAAEAFLIIYLVQFVTKIEVIDTFKTVCLSVFEYIRKTFIK